VGRSNLLYAREIASGLRPLAMTHQPRAMTVGVRRILPRGHFFSSAQTHAMANSTYTPSIVHTYQG
jgi:hypothetical protein